VRLQRGFTVCTVCVLVLAFGRARPVAQAPVPLDTLLTRVFAYVERFQREFGSMVAEERYDQWIRSTGPNVRGDTSRTLRSDFLLVNVPGQGWTPFRDVFEADGRQVRDRQDRLTKLFLSGTKASALEQARRIMDEGARYNLGGGSRNINVPTLALMYLTADVRGGVRFSDGKPDRAAAGRVITFTEIAHPTLISTTNGRDLAASGRIWADEVTGTITRTELQAIDTAIESMVTVTFAFDEKVATWVPQRMEDRIRRRGDQSEVRGVATYTRFRRFQVSTSEEVASDDVDKSK
jgi:hypothetical protein